MSQFINEAQIMGKLQHPAIILFMTLQAAG